jgi:anti-sigma regulatory factor (Ser/Thr protein kinase)
VTFGTHAGWEDHSGDLRRADSVTSEVTTTFPVDAASPAAARRFLQQALSDEHPCVRAAQLAVSELVTNVVRHAPGVPSIALIARFDPRSVRLEVKQDQSPGDGTEPRIAARWPDAAQLDGRGLRIVAALSRRWGVVLDTETVVWCEVEC